MRVLISSMTILLSSDRREVLSWHSVPGPSGENSELRDKLIAYFTHIGVTSYSEYKDGKIEWALNNRIYTTEQIERMMALKVFS